MFERDHEIETGSRTTEETWKDTPYGRASIAETSAIVTRRADALCRAFGVARASGAPPTGQRTAAGRSMAALARKADAAAGMRVTPTGRIASAVSRRAEAVTRARSAACGWCGKTL